MPRNDEVQKYQLDLINSLNFRMDEFIDEVVKTSGMSVEEFAVYYVIDVYPAEVETKTTYSVNNEIENNAIRITQEVRIRPKTPEEMQLALEAAKKEKNVDSE
jgi:hypothetical protein